MRTRWLLPILLLLPACAWIAHRPQADVDPIPSDPWRVRCSWMVENEPGDEAGQTAWEWASDEDGRRLLVEGALEDGFVRVDRVRFEVDDDEPPAPPPAATAKALHDLCLASVRRENPGLSPDLASVTAASPGEDVDLTMVFADASDDHYSRLVIFGDSLSDSGNLKRSLLVFPAAPYWLGRFSDGPNWSDWIVRSTDLAVQNHAYGGALAVPHENVPTTSIIAAVEHGGLHFVSGSVESQVNDYIGKELTGGRVQRPWETVFVLWEGANDYLTKELDGNIATLLDAPSSEGGYERIVHETVAAIATQVRQLYAAGARVFVIITLPDLGDTPIVLHNTSYQPRDHPSESARLVMLSRQLSRLTALHNQQVASAMASLRRELPSATIVVIDARRIFDRMTGPQGGDYGFDLVSLRRTVRDGGTTLHLQDGCYTSSGYIESSDPSKICPQKARAVFWDTLHPSSFTNCWMAWFFRREMAEADLLPAPPPQRDYRSFCEKANP